MRDLTPLFEPRSVALVGASNDPMKWGGWFAISLLGQQGAPPLHLVARRGGEIGPAGRAVAARPRRGARPRDPVDPGGRGASRPWTTRCRSASGPSWSSRRASASWATRAQRRQDAAGRDGARGRRGCWSARTASACSTRTRGLNATGGDQPTGGVSLASQSGNLALEVGLMLTAERPRLRALRLRRQPGRHDPHRRALVDCVDHDRRGVVAATSRTRSTAAPSSPRCARWPRPASRRWC